MRSLPEGAFESLALRTARRSKYTLWRLTFSEDKLLIAFEDTPRKSVRGPLRTSFLDLAAFPYLFAEIPKETNKSVVSSLEIELNSICEAYRQTGNKDGKQPCS